MHELSFVFTSWFHSWLVCNYPVHDHRNDSNPTQTLTRFTSMLNICVFYSFNVTIAHMNWCIVLFCESHLVFCGDVFAICHQSCQSKGWQHSLVVGWMHARLFKFIFSSVKNTQALFACMLIWRKIFSELFSRWSLS